MAVAAIGSILLDKTMFNGAGDLLKLRLPINNRFLLGGRYHTNTKAIGWS
jgi:hypothetical protein